LVSLFLEAGAVRGTVGRSTLIERSRTMKVKTDVKAGFAPFIDGDG
jgi:hypothetical protein